ncbi:MAG: BON domain-containing protein [Thiocapsa sp.]|jgi:osmotically-inducible protein OsmY|nr:BON domain-containing protein [Thiocapsa sp.]MCG6896626.1 BON domain-containing protein [Thiocapsa sp.]MCG6986002.1 BON domain-containing protein [Thiocapsa sp.]
MASSPAVLILLLIGGSLLQGCGPLLVGGAAVGAASAVHDRRTYDAFIDDQQIELAAMSALLNDPRAAQASRISVTSYNRKVLLTGQADTDEVAERASSLVSRLPKVQRVIDEIVVGSRLSLARETEDGYVTSRVKAALIDVALPGFDPTRVKVVTEDGTVYLMGILSPAEADAATEKVRYVPGVKSVVKIFEYVDRGS